MVQNPRLYERYLLLDIFWSFSIILFVEQELGNSDTMPKCLGFERKFAIAQVETIVCTWNMAASSTPCAKEALALPATIRHTAGAFLNTKQKWNNPHVTLVKLAPRFAATNLKF